jgi:hypothetical protein
VVDDIAYLLAERCFIVPLAISHEADDNDKKDDNAEQELLVFHIFFSSIKNECLGACFGSGNLLRGAAVCAVNV